MTTNEEESMTHDPLDAALSSGVASLEEKPKRTRRPRTLSTQLIELRDTALARRAKLVEKQSKLRASFAHVNKQLEDVDAELERVRMAIGDARDTERADVVRTVAVVEGRNGAPDTAEVVQVDSDGSVVVESQHPSVAGAQRALRSSVAADRDNEYVRPEHAGVNGAGLAE